MSKGGLEGPRGHMCACPGLGGGPLRAPCLLAPPASPTAAPLTPLWRMLRCSVGKAVKAVASLLLFLL